MKKMLKGIMVITLVWLILDHVIEGAKIENYDDYNNCNVIEDNSYIECETIVEEDYDVRPLVNDDINALVMSNRDEFDTEEEWRNYWTMQLHIH